LPGVRAIHGHRIVEGDRIIVIGDGVIEQGVRKDGITGNSDLLLVKSELFSTVLLHLSFKLLHHISLVPQRIFSLQEFTLPFEGLRALTLEFFLAPLFPQKRLATDLLAIDGNQ
jgi:hypothetical protein